MLDQMIPADVVRWWRNKNRPRILLPTVYCPHFDPRTCQVDNRQVASCLVREA